MAHLRHPKGLYVLFLTEMWERFSYYGMRALLVLYLVEGLHESRGQALRLYAIYTAFVYLTPMVGGYLADRWLGSRRAIMIGGIVMAMGHFSMALPGALDIALCLLIVGNGFFKPNISTLVGALYHRDDPRRDGGFTIFYMGINLGALMSPLICGMLGEKFGWHYGFAAAGIGMVLGVLIFILGQKHLVGVKGHAHRARFNYQDWLIVLVTSLVCLLLVLVGVHFWNEIEAFWHHLVTWQRALLVVSILLAIVLPGRREKDSKPSLTLSDIKHTLAIFIIGVFVVVFWMGFEQAGGTMNLFALERTDRLFGHWEMPASFFQALNPLLILVLAPVFSLLFVWSDQKRFGLSTPAKMAVGMIILGLGFALLALAQEHSEAIGRVSPLWLVGVYWLHTIGELFLSPIGLSMVTRLAPVQLASFMMGLWFTAVAVANYLAGTLEAMLQHSGIPLYWFLVSSSIGAGLLLLSITPILKRLMKD